MHWSHWRENDKERKEYISAKNLKSQIEKHKHFWAFFFPSEEFGKKKQKHSKISKIFF